MWNSEKLKMWQKLVQMFYLKPNSDILLCWTIKRSKITVKNLPLSSNKAHKSVWKLLVLLQAQECVCKYLCAIGIEVPCCALIKDLFKDFMNNCCVSHSLWRRHIVKGHIVCCDSLCSAPPSSVTVLCRGAELASSLQNTGHKARRPGTGRQNITGNTQKRSLIE